MRKIGIIIKRLTDNEYAYSVIAKVLGILVGLVYMILYSRYLGADLRGEAAVISNFATLASLGACLGIYQAYPYFRKTRGIEQKKLYMEYINNCLGLCLLYAMVCGLVVYLVPLSLSRKVSFLLIPLMVGTKLLNYVVLIETPKLRNTASIYLFLIDIAIVGLLMIFTKATTTTCFFFLIAKEIVYFCIAFHNLKISLLSIRPTMKGILPYVKYGSIPIITVILMEINYKIDVLMLDGRVPAAEIGIYSLGVQLAERVWLIPDALKDILLSRLTKGKGAEEVAKITRISLAAMMICIVLAVVFGQVLIDLIFGKEYSDAYGIMLVILVSVISMVFYKMVYSFNVANGHRVVNALILGLAAMANVGINALLIPRMGIMGAAVASLISYSVCGLTFLLYFVHKTGVPVRKMLFVTKDDVSQMTGIFRRNSMTE